MNAVLNIVERVSQQNRVNEERVERIANTQGISADIVRSRAGEIAHSTALTYAEVLECFEQGTMRILRAA